jgi:heme-degrading monooxygenase HmoA
MGSVAMYVVIFRAQAGHQDETYSQTVARMRDLAFENYGCLDFVSVSEGDQEIALSYWESEAAITAWKNNAEHLMAQEKGRTKWYRSYTVQVAKIEREYGSRR